MLTATAVRNPEFLREIRRAMRMAGVRAIATGKRVTSDIARNRRGVPAVNVVLHLDNTGHPAFEFIDSRDRDITEAVRAAFQFSNKAGE